MQVLNPKQSSEKCHMVPEADPLAGGAGDGDGTIKTRTIPSTGVTDGIELHRDHDANQASPGPLKENKALDECVPVQRDSSRVTESNVKGASVNAPGRGIAPGKLQWLATKRGNARRAKGATHLTTRGSRRMHPTPRGRKA